MQALFADRRDGGRVLGRMLEGLRGRDDVVVLALPRGGVPVGFELARALGAPLDVFMVRKLGVPVQPELAMGAVASGGVRVLNPSVVRGLRIPAEVIDEETRREVEELRRRERAYRGGRPPPEVRGRTVVLVDDGLATGSTMRAAAAAVKQMGPARVIVAVPVGAAETCELLRREVDEVVCAATPEDFFSVGAWYEDFAQTTDEEVRELLEQAEEERRRRAAAGGMSRQGA